MEYTGAQSERAVAAGDLDRGSIGHTVSFQPDESTVVFGRIAGIARTADTVYLALDGVAGGAQLKHEYALPAGRDVYLQVDVITNAESTIKDLFGKVQDNLRGSGHRGEDRTDRL